MLRNALTRQTVGFHWPGQLTAAEALLAGLWIILSLRLVLALVWVFMSTTGYLAWHRPVLLVLLMTGAACIVAMLKWWVKGLFSPSNRLLSDNSLWSSSPAYVLACGATWMLFTDVLPGAIGDLNNETTTLAEYFACRKVQADLKNPAVIVALDAQRLYLSGPIGSGTADVLARAIEANPGTKLLELDSLGGWVSESDAMRALVQSYGMNTMVRGRCASACTNVFISGQSRYVSPDARFGFHRSGLCGGNPVDAAWTEQEHTMAALYKARGVDPAFTDKALNTAHESTWKPPTWQVKESGFATGWWPGLARP